MNAPVTAMGIYVADLVFWAPRMPKIGETVLGTGFATGPGGKGSNQAVAASRAGAEVSFITKIGKDELAEQVRQLYIQERIDQEFVFESSDWATGAAFIFKDRKTGDNAIIVSPAPSMPLPDSIYPRVDYFTPNETGAGDAFNGGPDLLDRDVPPMRNWN